MIERTKDESGYSLVEVMVSIFLLSIAIIPMVGMFDAGLESATTSGNYDKARTLANQQLERAKSLPYDEVKIGFPGGTGAPDSDGEITSSAVSAPASAGLPTGSTYTVTKRYLRQPDPYSGPSSEDFGSSATDTRLLKVTVTVGWDGKTYETSGVVAG